MPAAITQLRREIDLGTIDPPFLMRMFHNCFYNTLETTTELLSDGTTFVFTGDIPAMYGGPDKKTDSIHTDGSLCQCLQ